MAKSVCTACEGKGFIKSKAVSMVRCSTCLGKGKLSTKAVPAVDNVAKINAVLAKQGLPPIVLG